MLAYRKFTDASPAPPKPAKAPKIAAGGQNEGETLGGLGALGEVAPEITNVEPLLSPSERALLTWAMCRTNARQSSSMTA